MMYVTVNQAITRGKQIVNYPAYAIMALSFGLFGYLIYLEVLPLWFIAPAFFLPYGLGWLYWSFAITQWRLWAFENVRNVHELKKLAVLNKLIWPAGSFFEKTEIRTTAQRKKWKELEQKFTEEDVFYDDFNVPAETKIYHVKWIKWGNVGVGVGLLGWGSYNLLIEPDYFSGIIGIVLGLVLLYVSYRDATDDRPQIIINDKGIQTVSMEFVLWKDITGEEVRIERTGKTTNIYLIYYHPKGSEKINIGELKTNIGDLTHLLLVYRGRSKR